jgi:hypothetical protein
MNVFEELPKEPDAPDPLTDEELRGIVESEIQQSVNHETSQIAIDQEKAIEYYEGRPFGNEVPGSSAVVMRTVAETVDWAMPALMRAIFYTSEVVRYEDMTPESAEAGHGARMTRVINEIFRERLHGLRFAYSWAKAGMLEGFATSKFWVETVREPQIPQVLTDLTEDALAQLAELPDVEILEMSEPRAQIVTDDAGAPLGAIQLYDVKVKRWKTFKRVRLETVPPEEFLCSRRATKLDQDIPFVAHRKRVTRSELHSLGVPWDLVAKLPSASLTADDGRAITRHENEAPDLSASSRKDEASQQVIATESYLRVDYDGDGFSELRAVLTGGESTQILLGHDYAEMHGFAGWAPWPMPHKLYGRNAKHAVGDLQDIGSTILRQMLDNMYRMNNARHKLKVEYVDLDSYLDTNAGAPVLVEEMDAIEALEVPALQPWAFEALQFIEKLKEQRLGIHPYSQEVYAAGQNQTAQGVSQVFEAAMAQIQLLAQMFGEGLADLFRIMPRMMKSAGMGKDRIKVGDEFIEYDPQDWPDEMRVAVQVGLSPGQTEQRIQRLLMLLGLQKEALQQGGEGYLVSMDQIYGTAVRIVEQSGFASPGAFFSNPAGKQPTPPTPDPKQIEAESGARDMQAGRILELNKLEFDREKERTQTARLESESMREHQRELMRIEMEERVRVYAADRQYEAAMLSAKARELDEQNKAAAAGPGAPGGKPERKKKVIKRDAKGFISEISEE